MWIMCLSALTFALSSSCPYFWVSDFTCCLCLRTKGENQNANKYSSSETYPQLRTQEHESFSFKAIAFVWICLWPLCLICWVLFIFQPLWKYIFFSFWQAVLEVDSWGFWSRLVNGVECLSWQLEVVIMALSLSGSPTWSLHSVPDPIQGPLLSLKMGGHTLLPASY